MIEDKSRLDDPRMDYYKEVFKDSPVWDGQTTGKRLIIYGEQGAGDIILTARYFRNTGNHTILMCDKSLHRLMLQTVDEVHDKEDANLPDHDYHILSLSLPFLVPETPCPYLAGTAPWEVPEEGIKVGIAWEGSSHNPNNKNRSCPLKNFRKLFTPENKVFMLQNKVYYEEFTEGCEDLELLGAELYDWLDTANLVAAMDYVVCVDTAPLQLAGAMGKKGYGLLFPPCDGRWAVKQWYPSLKLLQGPKHLVFERIG